MKIEHSQMTFEEGKTYYFGGNFECAPNKKELDSHSLANSVFKILSALDISDSVFTYDFEYINDDDTTEDRIFVSLLYREEVDDIDKMMNLIDTAFLYIATRLDLNMNVELISYAEKPGEPYEYCIDFNLSF